MIGLRLVGLAAGIGLCGVIRPVAAQDRLGTAGARIAALIDSSGASVGVGVRHLETGAEWFHQPDHPFLMGSTFKVAVAVQLLTRVDQERSDSAGWYRFGPETSSRRGASSRSGLPIRSIPGPTWPWCVTSS